MYTSALHGNKTEVPLKNDMGHARAVSIEAVLPALNVIRPAHEEPTVPPDVVKPIPNVMSPILADGEPVQVIVILYVVHNVPDGKKLPSVENFAPATALIGTSTEYIGSVGNCHDKFPPAELAVRT
jgi:hypothetical protein